jgi:hypothetical protein
MITLAVLTACGDDTAYCERARMAFDEIEQVAADPAARQDAADGLDRLKSAFASFDDDAPDEIRDDVAVLTEYVAGVDRPEQLADPEPAEVRAAGDRFAAWLGRTCNATT